MTPLSKRVVVIDGLQVRIITWCRAEEGPIGPSSEAKTEVKRLAVYLPSLRDYCIRSLPRAVESMYRLSVH